MRAQDMLIRLWTSIAIILLTGSCGQERGVSNTVDSAQAKPGLRAASIGPHGYATITDAPPADFAPAEPGAGQPPTPAQAAGHAQFAQAGRFQNEVMGEVQALAHKLRTAEKENFVDLYFDNEGEPRVVFRFLRNGQATLARYTRHPRFFAETARFSNRELRQARDFMFATFRDDRVIQSGGTGNRQNRAMIEIAVTEPEFRALVARKGVTIPEAVQLVFVAEAPATALNRPLAAEIAPLVRIFPRDNRPLGMLHSIDSRLKVALRDGCFRAAGGDHDGALVLFPLGAQLFVDPEGYLAYGGGAAPGYARVGEELVFPGSIAEVTSPDLADPVRKACGSGKVVKVNGMRSAAAGRAQEAVTQNANTLRFFRENYGLSEADARRALEACKARSGSGVCFATPPPPPPPRGGPACPPGTKPVHGMCRTPEGYVWPIPDWLQALIAG